MYDKEVLVQNQVGLHARPATFFIQKANEYKSSIWVEKEERRVSFLYTLVISSVLVLYYRYQNKFKYLRFIVHEGVAIGFISFIYVNIFLVLNLFLPLNSFYAGLIMLILIIFTFILSYYFKLIFDINRFVALFNDIMRSNIKPN